MNAELQIPGLGGVPRHLVKINEGQRPTICFATMCKNEAHIIGETLEAVRPFVDSFLVYDTGSDDGTLDVVHAFFDRHGIDSERGRTITASWEGFAKSKTQMMAEARSRTQWERAADYVLHLDADDIVESFVPTEIDRTKDCFFATLTRGTDRWQATVLYDNRLTWRFCGVAHTIIRAVERPQCNTGTLPSCRVKAEPLGSRILDPQKYLDDAEKLVVQFRETEIEDPDGLHARSAFYAAQSYFDAKKFGLAAEWYATFLDIGTWEEERFEAHLRRARCFMILGPLGSRHDLSHIRTEIDLALSLQPDRAEPLVHFGTWCNQNGYHEEAYRALTQARTKRLELVRDKYLLFVNQFAYGKHVADELAVACYWTGRCMEGQAILRAVLDDPDLAHARPNMRYNLDQLEAAAVRSGRDVRGITRATPRFVVVDDFYEDALGMRNVALAMQFHADDRYHKGRRTLEAHRPDAVRAELGRLLNRQIKKWDYATNGVFQICKAGDPLVYHTDDQQYAAVVFLTPNAPAGAGTSFFREKSTGARGAFSVPVPAYMRGHYDASQFELVDQVGNIFNRCVVWDAQLLHAASSYFGDKDENARLFQIFFFDVD